jgi:hypothetical protein
MSSKPQFFDRRIQTQSDGNSGEWKRSYQWGDHSLSGYITGVIEDTTPSLGGNLDTNNYNISGDGNIFASTGFFDVISFNTDNESILAKGQISWDDTHGVVDIGLTDNTAIHIGEHRFFRIRNETGNVLYKGQPVYATGVHNNGIITPSLYIADGTIREVRFMGLVLEDVNNNNNGYVIDFGLLEELDLDGSATNYAVGDETWLSGDILYVHPTVSGKLTNVEPQHSISVAIILDRGNGNGNGKLFVRPISYGHLTDNHDINISDIKNNQYLAYDTGINAWINTSGGLFDSLTVGNYSFPTSDGTANQIIQTDGGGNLSFADISSVGGLSSIVEDTTPQLGGNLDLNGNNIIGTGNISIEGNMGIGTGVPVYNLEVVGTGNFTQNLLVNEIPVSVSGHFHEIADVNSLSGVLENKLDNDDPIEGGFF